MTKQDPDCTSNIEEAKRFLKNISLVVIGLILSYFFVSQSNVNQKPSVYDELMQIIHNNYVDTVQIKAIEKNAVSNLLSALDPHSIYITKDELQAANEPLEGNFSGIGIEFYIARDTITVVSPIPGGPSELVGIKPGDKVIMINDTLVAGVKISNSRVFKQLRGIKDSKVKLTISRSGKLLTPFVIKRDNIRVNSIETSILLDSNTGYIKINSFGENTYAEFYEQLSKLKSNPNFNSLIIDVRQNTGGFLEIAVAILDELIADRQLLVYTEGLHYRKESFYTKKTGLFEEGDVTILIDEGSASASEILAGAIQDLDRGTVIGRRSFGKGLVQHQIPLSDGSAVRLTIARYFTPSGRNIQKPYKTNENYDEEIYDRYKNGEFFEHKSDANDTTYFLTKNGRKVKAGGGISPDIFVSIDTNYDYQNFLILRSFIPDFIYSNYDHFSPEANQYNGYEDFSKHYKVSTNDIQNFYAFAKNNGAKWSQQKKSSFEPKLASTMKAYIAKQFFGAEGFYHIMSKQDNVIQRALKGQFNRQIIKSSTYSIK